MGFPVFGQPFGSRFGKIIGQSFRYGLMPIRFEFLNPLSAPLVSPYTENGHSLTLVQNDGQLSISSDKLQIPQQVTPAFGDLGYYSEPIPRVIGRTSVYEITRTGGTATKEILVGWSTSAAINTATLRYGVYITGANIFFWEPSFTPLLSTSFADSTSYRFLQPLRSVGSFLFAKGGVFTNNTLLWVDDLSGTSPLYCTWNSTTAIATEDYIRVDDLPDPFTSDDGIVNFVDTTLVSTDTFIGTSDALCYFDFTLSGAPSALDEIALYYRYTDTSNSWKAYIRRNVTNTAWDFRLDSVSLGVPTNRIAVTGVGTPDALCVIYDGSKHNCFTRAGLTWTKRGGEINVSFQDTNTGLSIVAVAGTILTKLKNWARTSSLYNVMDTL